MYLYDLLYLEGDVHGLPFEERLGMLRDLSGQLGPRFVVLPQRRVTSATQLTDVGKGYLEFGPPVEGVVARDPAMPYTFGATSDYAKTKIYVELKVRVVNVNSVESGYTYTGALVDDDGSEVVLGDTFVSSEKLADVGDTLNVRIEELEITSDGQLAWHKPTPLGPDRSRGPYTVRQAISLARRFGRLSDSRVSKVTRVPGRAAPRGPRTATVAFVGDAPGARDVKEGFAFSGPSGDLLREVLAELGAEPETMFFTNVFEEGRADISDSEAVHARGSSLLQDLDSMPQLQAVVALGTVAAQALTGYDADLSSLRGHEFHTPEGVPIVVTYHPAAVLRTGRDKSRLFGEFKEDIKDALEIAAPTVKHLPGKHNQKRHAGAVGVAEAAGALWGQGASNVDAVQENVVRVVRDLGGEMRGLEYRMKTRDGVNDKIKREFRANTDWTVDDVVREDVWDVVRFTGTFNHRGYYPNVASAANKLRDGFEVTKTKNYWADPEPEYQAGIHLKLVHKETGQRVELQFHTPESYNVKTQIHKLYEEARRPSTRGRRKKELKQAMDTQWSNVPSPTR